MPLKLLYFFIENELTLYGTRTRAFYLFLYFIRTLRLFLQLIQTRVCICNKLKATDDWMSVKEKNERKKIKFLHDSQNRQVIKQKQNPKIKEINSIFDNNNKKLRKIPNLSLINNAFRSLAATKKSALEISTNLAISDNGNCLCV